MDFKKYTLSIALILVSQSMMAMEGLKVKQGQVKQSDSQKEALAFLKELKKINTQIEDLVLQKQVIKDKAPQEDQKGILNILRKREETLKQQRQTMYEDWHKKKNDAQRETIKAAATKKIDNAKTIKKQREPETAK